MKNLFVFAVLVIFMITAAQANSSDTIVAGKVVYQATYGGKILHIQKDSTAIISGVDSVVTIKSDTTKNSEKVAIYANGKKFAQWVRPGYTSTGDPADTTGNKLIINIMGGDANTVSDPPISLLYVLLIVCFLSGLFYGGYRWLR